MRKCGWLVIFLVLMASLAWANPAVPPPPRDSGHHVAGQDAGAKVPGVKDMAPTEARPEPEPESRRSAAIVGLALAVVLAGGGLWAARRRRPSA